MPCHENFFKKSFQALSSWNLTCEGVESKEDALERRGFQNGADLRLGAIEEANV